MNKVTNYIEAYELFRNNNPKFYSERCNELEDCFRFFPDSIEKYNDEEFLNDIFHFFTKCVTIYKIDGHEESEEVTPFDDKGKEHDLKNLNEQIFGKRDF